MKCYTRAIVNKIIVIIIAVTLMLPLAARAQSREELVTALNSLLAQLAELQSKTATPQEQPTPEFCFNFSKDLRRGDSNEEVKSLQQALSLEGFSVPVTGFFGALTLEAVQRFQLKMLGDSTGFVGPLTRSKLNDRYKCDSPPIQPPVQAPPVKPPPSPLPATIHYDVIVVGAGSGGIAAAIQAARLGSTVALVEETDWIGGQMLPVGNMDEYWFPQNRGGIYAEFLRKSRDYYLNQNNFPPNGKSVGTCYWTDSRNCFEPKVIRQVLQSMISAEPNLKLFTETKVTGVLKSNNKVSGIRLANGSSWSGKVIIDATEYGDVIPLTGAAYRTGNSLSSSINPNACIQDITYVAPVKKYPTGVPPELKLNNPPPKYSIYKEEFKLTVAKNGGASYPLNWAQHNRYRGLPDSSNPQSYTALEPEKITKTNLNWTNDYPAYAAYISSSAPKETLKVAYLENSSERKRLNCEAKLKTLNFIYYVQHELGEPDWSVANDEGFSTPYNEANLCDNIPAEFKSVERHFPPFPYVRESRRIVPVDTLTALEIKNNKDFLQHDFVQDAIAVGDYGADLHNCNQTPELEGYLGEVASHQFRAGPFQVPIGALIPQAVDGFLAAEKNIGATRLANGATRLQPITMHTGQAAGIMAALAVQKGIEVRNVDPLAVQEKLVNAKQYVSKFEFADMPLGHVFWKFGQILSSKGFLLSADGGFNSNIGVNTPISRKEAAVLAAKRFGLSGATPSSPTFADVPLTHPQFREIEAIYAGGLTAGCMASPLRYCPDDPATRLHLAVFSARGMKLPPVAGGQIFADVPPDNFAHGLIQALYQKGVFAGCSSSPLRFCPNEPITRGQAAAFLGASVLVR